MVDREFVVTQIIDSILPHPKRTIVYIHPAATVSQCVDLMVREDIGAVVVTDEDNNIFGTISERDIVRSLVKRGLSPEETKVSDILCADITLLKHTDSIDKAMEEMTRTKRRHILVTDDEKLVAIISSGDILCSLLESKSQEVEHLENYIHNY